MRKVIYGLIPCLLVTLLCCASCKRTAANETPNNIAYDTLSVVEIYHLDNDSVKPSCSLQVTYIYPDKYEDEKILSQIQNELNVYLFEDESYLSLPAREALEKYKKAYVENYKQDVVMRFPDWEKSGETMDYFSYYKKINTHVLFDKGGILSYQIVSRDYKGGANSSTYYQNLVFDTKTGKRLNEEDIFVPEYKDTLGEFFVAEILKQNKAESTQQLMEDLGFFGIEDIPFNNNFIVNETGIDYTFNEGEIAPQSVGAITIHMPYEEIISLLKDNSPISHFYN
ncbi:RsiV family protein [Dysgonomonas sp. 25]|uniref:RsiV family protein n=1 Tax=Dysgonomonas sp. 25 TaxID=2302933 RepID=UPI0013D1C45B|nr:RsiV family protein [Dysgonomonas sp. 25]NDV68985.1 DUF3298 domain-containing protein [Dysgonomonas sp. 25]